MTQIILDTTPTQLVLQSHDPVRICDPEGNVIGIVAPAPISGADDCSFTTEEIAAAKRALATPGPGRTTKEVLARLRAFVPFGRRAKVIQLDTNHSANKIDAALANDPRGVGEPARRVSYGLNMQESISRAIMRGGGKSWRR